MVDMKTIYVFGTLLALSFSGKPHGIFSYKGLAQESRCLLEIVGWQTGTKYVTFLTLVSLLYNTKRLFQI